MGNKLLRFRVKNFRSIEDSGWVNTDDVNCFVGTNESGKTNLLAALWKLRPSNQEPVSPLRDYPRALFDNFEKSGKNDVFILAHIVMSQTWALKASRKSGLLMSFCQTAIIGRNFSGEYKLFWAIPNSNSCLPALQGFYEHILKKDNEEERRGAAQYALNALKKLSERRITPSELFEISNAIDAFEAENDREGLTEILTELRYVVQRTYEFLTEDPAFADADLLKEAVAQLPVFVYYADYGNIDADIYLPHLIEDFSRDNLGEKEQAKVRTLKVLFDFLKLNPKEILSLGSENREKDINKLAEMTKKREILLQAASQTLSKKFKELWKQGDYKFRLQADGSYLRIWVSDGIRPEEVELEARSKGLQWFVSFFLVFTMESAKKDSIILLDEAGLSLHPLAQADLLNFIRFLSEKNQVLYTTHSPYLVDLSIPTYVVHVNSKGQSAVLQDWQHDKKTAEASVFTLRSAVFSHFFTNFDYEIILVAETTEQIYYQEISRILASQQHISLSKPLLFLPSQKGIDLIINLLGYYPKTIGFTENYPPEKIISLPANCLTAEDLMPKSMLAKEFSRLNRNEDGDDFDECADLKMPFCEQANAFCEKNQIFLPPQWRFDLAKKFTTQLKNGKYGIDEHHIALWKNFFEPISGLKSSEKLPEKNQENSIDFVKMQKIILILKQKFNFILEEIEELPNAENISKEINKLKKNLLLLEKSENFAEIAESTVPERLKKLPAFLRETPLDAKFIEELEAESRVLTEIINIP